MQGIVKHLVHLSLGLCLLGVFSEAKAGVNINVGIGPAYNGAPRYYGQRSYRPRYVVRPRPVVIVPSYSPYFYGRGRGAYAPVYVGPRGCDRRDYNRRNYRDRRGYNRGYYR